MIAKQRVVLYVKYPQAGKVKTRLAKYIGAEEAAELYHNFVLDILATIERAAFDVSIHFAPDISLSAIQEWLPGMSHYLPQRGTTLGERMRSSFEDEFEAGADHVVLVGSDIPQLSCAIFSDAFAALQDGVVPLGPATDGGYYLIGFSRDNFSPVVFENIKWSSENVFTDTMQKLSTEDRAVSVLAALCDIDTLDDLCELIKNSLSFLEESKHCARWLKGRLASLGCE